MQLSWYEACEDASPLGSVTVGSSCRVRDALHSSSIDPLAFELVTPARVYLWRAETEADRIRWMEALEECSSRVVQGDDFEVITFGEVASEENTRRPSMGNISISNQNSLTNTSVDYIAVDLDESESSFTMVAMPESPPPSSLSPAAVHNVRVIESEPRSSGLLFAAPPAAGSDAGQAARVVGALRALVGPPSRSEGPIGPVLHELGDEQIDWMAPLLLALEKSDVTEIILHLAAKGSSALRLHLICLHASGFTSAHYARVSVNTLFDISARERNTLEMVSWLDSQRAVAGGSYARVMCHPLTGAAVTEMRVRKVFATSARPMMVEFRNGEGSKVPPMVLTKSGDDLRVDLQVQVMFRLFNALWEVNGYEFKHGQLPYCVTYRVCPFSSVTGVLEVVPRCVSLYEHTWVSYDKHRTVSSAIGAFVAGYMLGVRDRHKDNILFSLDTLELFHVDFGYVFNSQTKMFDAPRFAIPMHFKQMLAETGQWQSFVENSVIAYRILRQNKDFIIDLCCRLFHGTNSDSVEAYLRGEAFLEHMSGPQADERIRYLVEKGPTSVKRILKNIAHAVGF